MSIEDIKKHLWCKAKKESDYSIINADRFDRYRRHAISDKIQKNLAINARQIQIMAYYFTTKGGLICWVKMEPKMIV